MKIGTKSVLFGAHCFFIHPWFVAAAWWKLFGFPWDPRLWVAFCVHDIGYWGKPNMDGPEGESHPFVGAKIMQWFFDTYEGPNDIYSLPGRVARFIGPVFDRLYGVGAPQSGNEAFTTWYRFVLYHSRFLSKRYGMPPSKLCIADKLAICITPAWLYIPMTNLTGEIHEYMKMSAKKEGDSPGKYASMHLASESQLLWYNSMRTYVRKWVEEHKDGREDTWTPKQKETRDEHGVWK